MLFCLFFANILVEMIMEKALKWITPKEKQIEIAKKIKSIRKCRGISQRILSYKSGVAYASITRFEQTGEISLASFVKILFALDLDECFDDLLNKSHYRSIEEVLRDK